MVDFTNCQVKPYKIYGGANGGKLGIVYNGIDYMLKFPSQKKGEISGYANSCISEYISCRIIETLGLNVQETILGSYIKNGANKVVVACRDFTSPVIKFKQFAELKNSQIETSENGYGTELSEVLETIENQVIYDSFELKDFFWEMFIADSLLGNFDRHNGNWGFLINEETGKTVLAPIFDCASCLYPQPSDADLESFLNDEKELEARVFVFPTSALKINDKKINYFDYISSLENEDLNKALLKIFPRIDLEKINKIIDSVSVISDVRKKFYKKIIKMRYEKILKFSYDKLTNK